MCKYIYIYIIKNNTLNKQTDKLKKYIYIPIVMMQCVYVYIYI